MNARPIYIKLLILAIILYVIGTTIIISDLYYSICRIKHELFHITGKYAP